jgi:hydrogenase nickel incorporation protein HypA/HybF
MHEYSLAKRIFDQASEIAAEHGGRKLELVVLSLGPLSGAEPLLLASAFAQIAAEEGQANVQLKMETTPLSITCDACHSISELVDFRFHCRACGGDQVQVCSGDQVILKSIVLSTVPGKGELSCPAN